MKPIVVCVLALSLVSCGGGSGGGGSTDSGGADPTPAPSTKDLFSAWTGSSFVGVTRIRYDLDLVGKNYNQNVPLTVTVPSLPDDGRCDCEAMLVNKDATQGNFLLQSCAYVQGSNYNDTLQGFCASASGFGTYIHDAVGKTLEVTIPDISDTPVTLR